MRPHIALSAIADHILGVKSLDAESLKHLDGCPGCRSDVLWLKVLRNLRESEPPESAVATTVKTFNEETDAA